VALFNLVLILYKSFIVSYKSHLATQS
jgi:hypothetical protein